jgi:hypothetical protein
MSVEAGNGVNTPHSTKKENADGGKRGQAHFQLSIRGARKDTCPLFLLGRRAFTRFSRMPYRGEDPISSMEREPHTALVNRKA